jgi:hypothetical protein
MLQPIEKLVSSPFLQLWLLDLIIKTIILIEIGQDFQKGTAIVTVPF